MKVSEILNGREGHPEDNEWREVIACFGAVVTAGILLRFSHLELPAFMILVMGGLELTRQVMLTGSKRESV